MKDDLIGALGIDFNVTDTFYLYAEFVASGGLYESGPKSARQSALEFQSARLKAMIDADIETLEGYLTDDLTYSHTTGWTETKAEFLSTVESKIIDYVSVTPTDVEVRTYGEIAVMTGLSRMQGTVGDRPVSFTTRFLDVSRRLGGSWQLVAWQSVKLREDEG